MKSKTEKKLDEEFERLGIIPRIYHFRKLGMNLNAITIATVSELDADDFEDEFLETLHDINISKHKPLGRSILYHHGSYVLHKLISLSYGAAVCDMQDQFSRQRGRIIAKGRLLKILREWKVITK
ncbi:MAG: hypothetical protein WA977_08415 [Halobacteriota archaeon]